MDVFPVDWQTADVPTGEDTTRFEIQCWSKNLQGTSVLLRIEFFPYFFVKVPVGWSQQRQRLFIDTCAQKLGALTKHSTPVIRKDLYGFTNNLQQPFIQLAFASMADCRRAKFAIPKSDVFDRLKTYEATLDPLLRFFHVRGVSPSAWLRANAATRVEPDARISIETVQEYTVSFANIGPSECAEVPPLVIASWDLECVSAKGMFPDPSAPRDSIITVGMALQRYGEPEPYKRLAITLSGCDDVPGVEVIACATEADVMNTFFDALHRYDADVMIGYNTTGFDFRYLDGRANVLTDEHGEPNVTLSKLGKAVEGGGLPVEKNLSSSAYGDNKYFYLSTPGVMQLDLLQIFRKELKLDSYSLGNVSAKYLEGHTKLDLKPGEIFEKFKGSDGDRAVIAEYCVRDVELPLKLMGKLHTLPNTLEMANVTCVPVEFLQTRGQQIRTYSMLTRKGRSLGFVVPDMERSNATAEKYEGATVLEARKGAYFDPIAALDFASLYPSIMRSHEMCPSTLVRSPRYDNVEGIEYYTIETGQGTFKFAQGCPSVTPSLLEDLAAFRKIAKKDMAAAKARGDDFAAALFNAKQLAFKVSMNSIYGFFGATKGIFPCVPIAASVTATGRLMIEHSKKLAEALVPGTEVIYGDSVADYTPVYLKRGSRSWITTFAALADELVWIPRADGKETAECGDRLVWSDAGWTRLERLIRHAYDPSRGLVRVLTHTGLVDVTPDHSLLTADALPVKPTEVAVGHALLHADIPAITTDIRVVTDPGLARIMGAAEVDGVPESILGASREVRQAFFEGMGGGARCSQYAAATVFALHTSLGLHPSLECGGDWGVVKVGAPQTTTDVVTGVEHIEYVGDYVYDATTANHHFAAGPGRMVVHNTDSIMCKFKVAEEKKHDMHEHFRVAQWVADEITKTFKAPIELEFEKVMWPYLLFSKKRYAGLMFTKPDTPDYVDVKGIQLVRRDSAPIVKTVSHKILDAVMHQRSTRQAVAAARSAVLRVIDGQEPLEQFIVSKALRANYANPRSQPHVQVANKIRERRGYPVTSGERVPYVFIEDSKNMDGLISSRAEDPQHVRENPDIKVDALYYITNQLMSPITALLEVLVDNVEAEVLGYAPIHSKLEVMTKARQGMVKESKRVKLNDSRKQPEITRYFSFKD